MLLNCHTYYSLKYGTVSIDEMYTELKKGGHEAFALTDINNTSACISTLKDANLYGIHASVGVDFRNGVRQQYICIAKTGFGFKEINEHLSRHLHHSLPFSNRAPDFAEVFVIYPLENLPATTQYLREHEYVGVRPGQVPKLYKLQNAAVKHKLVVLHTASFRGTKDYNAHRLLRAIDNNTLLSQLPISEQGDRDQLYLSSDQIRKLFTEFPEVIKNTSRLLSQCYVQLDFSTNKNKSPYTASVAEDMELLRKESLKGMMYRYGNLPPKNVMPRLNKELDMIGRLGFGAYFLINWDLVRYAQSKNFYYVGRGSGANSLVAYLLKITDVDPVELDLYFERFINPYRSSPPDFDVDFSWTDRDEVAQHLFDTHGHEKTALVGTYSTFQHNSVFRELGKVFGLPSLEITRFQNDPKAGLKDAHGKHVVKYAGLISGLPNHLSVHSSGILISQEPISSYSGTFMPPKGFPTTQFNMHVAEEIGLHKFDVLSQRGLGKIKDSIEIIRVNKGKEIDAHNIKAFKKDSRIKALLKNGKTIGCFYIESPAMRMLLTKLQVEDYLSLVAASSIIRPGVSKSGMMREYILRHRDKKRRQDAKRELPELYQLMEGTYGVMVYQEDVIKVAHCFAGLTLAEADVLRRGMSWSFRKKNEFNMVKDRFFSNCRKKGCPDSLISRIWEQMESFANYAFAKGHSASYAVESFQALYLKAYYPLEYLVATLNNGGGFYSAELYLHEARLLGGTIEAPCVNSSDQITTIQGKTIYLGLSYVSGLETSLMASIIHERSKNGAYQDLKSFVDRVFVSLEQLLIIIRAGAFRFTKEDKKQLLWSAYFLLGHNKKKWPEPTLFESEVKEFTLPKLWHHQLENCFDELELLGFTLSSPFLLLKSPPPSQLVSTDLPGRIGEKIRIVGHLVTRKNTKTNSGKRMGFGVFLDLNGQWLDSVHFPDVLERFPFRGPGCYLITGFVKEEFGFITIETQKLQRLENQNIETPPTRTGSGNSPQNDP